jgi:hypothetical protein
MTFNKKWLVLGMICAAAMALAACGPAATATPAPTTATTYTDPFAYCAAVGTIDQPDARYSGPAVPDSVAEALRTASGAAADAPLSIFESNSHWRCMDGKVYGCFVGANIPCEDKADTSRTPTSAENEFCQSQPNADVIPAVVTGRDTVYEWRCTDDQPEIVRQVFEVDAQGYISEFWYVLSPN